MKRASLLVLTVMVASLGLSTSSWAKKKKRMSYPYENVAGTTGGNTGVDIVIAEDGTGFIHDIGGFYQILDRLSGSLGWGYVVTGEGDLCPGNIKLTFGSSLWTENLKGPNAYLTGNITFGLGLFDLDSLGAARGAALGIIANQSWTGFFAESVVIQPKIRFGTRLGGLGIGGSIATAFAVPMFDTDVRDTEIALRYNISLGTGFGDRRGGLGFSVGAVGLSQLTGAENNSVLITASVGLRLRIMQTEYGRHMIRPGVSGSIPLIDDNDAGIDGIVSIGVGYYIDATRYEEVNDE